jgi:diadenosine tetraphosphate (Ap4A) HIT family hydrolase
MSCPFCHSKKIQARIYYENINWIAFLAVPYNTWGHTIIAARKKGKECPTVEVLHWCIPPHFDSALAKVAPSLMRLPLTKYGTPKIKHVTPKGILLASVRGDIAHFHFHLIPLWKEEEKDWRTQQRYGDPGHLLEYLGFLEKSSTKRALFERIANGWSEEEQREEITKTLKPYVEELRNLTGYRR